MRLSLLASFAAGIILIASVQADARETILTGAHGRTVTRDISRGNSGNGNLSRSVSTTGPNGQTRTKQFAQINNGNGTVTDTRTVTGPNGQYSGSVTRY